MLQQINEMLQQFAGCKTGRYRNDSSVQGMEEITGITG